MLLYHKKQWFCLQWGLHFHHLLPQHVTHFMILGSPILEYVTVRNIHFWISIVNDLSLNYYYYCFYHMSLIQGIFMSTDCLPKWATAFITGCSISRGFPRIQTTKPRKQPTHCQTQIWYSYWNISHKNIPYPCWNLVESLFLMVKSTISVTSLIEPSKFSGGFSSIFFLFSHDIKQPAIGGILHDYGNLQRRPCWWSLWPFASWMQPLLRCFCGGLGEVFFGIRYVGYNRDVQSISTFSTTTRFSSFSMLSFFKSNIRP